MKTIDKVRVFWIEGLYDAYLNNEGLEDNAESNKLFHNLLNENNLVTDGYYVIGYDIDSLFGYKSSSYIDKLEYLEEGNEIKIKSIYDPYGAITISWDVIYNSLAEHENKEDYFASEEVEKLVKGETNFDDFTNKAVNQFTIDFIKVFVLEDIKGTINSMTTDNLTWR